MLKNRDAPPNPYRVPRQPTPVWLKISLVALFLSDLALIGGVVYLTFYRDGRCDVSKCTVDAKSADPKRAQPSIEIQRTEARLAEENLAVQNRLSSVEETAASLLVQVNHAKEMARESQNRLARMANSDVTMTRSEPVSTLTSTQQANLRKIPRMEEKIRGLETKIDNPPTVMPQMCQPGHYRYGIYCYAIVEAKLTQELSENFCSSLYGEHAHLAIIKDQLTHDFVTSKLPNRQHSYWIGINRPGQIASGQLTASLTEGPAPSTLSGGQSYRYTGFEYLDGNRIHRSAWKMWKSSTGGATAECVALYYDLATETWWWQQTPCADTMNYVCQYFIMSS